VESFYATNQTYVGANAATDVTQSGVFGTGSGQANVTASSSNGYTIVGYSASNNTFTITKNGTTGVTSRTCATTSMGACPSSGTW
jgi:hypothetical protein